MITWENLLQCIERLETLPNGSGTEIEFTYNGVEYGIVSYRDNATISKLSEMYFDGKTLSFSDETVYEFKSLRELGKSNIFGFVLENIWNDLSEQEYAIRPDFDGFGFDEIYHNYQKSCKKK
ncbi:MAG: hypothetical protein K5695_00250 [Oscillospiraceae bacterium]|nr:hypothetical protein [Oscillospiraceae bacterium]